MQMTSRWKGISRRDALFIFVITLIVYSPVFRAGFIWDDDTFLTGNDLILSSDGLWQLWFSTDAPDYFPLVSTSLWLEWRLWGANAAGYHTVNVFLHAISSVLVYILFRESGIKGAWLAAVLFAVHPVNVESVAWITERKNTLTMPLYLATILFFFRFQLTDGKGAYAAAVFLFALSLLCKTSVVMLPVVLLGLIWWKKGILKVRDVQTLLPFFLLSLLMGGITVWFQYNRAIGGEFIRDDGFFLRFAIAGIASWFYLYKAIFPLNLSFVYPKWDFSEPTVLIYLPSVLFLFMLFFFWRNRRSWGVYPFLSLSYFLVTLLPVLGFLNIFFMKYSYVADHWQYFSIIGLIGFGAAVWGGLHEKSIGKKRFFLKSLGVLLVTFYGSLTFIQAGIYKNELTLYDDIIKKNKDCWMAYNNRGHFFDKNGFFKKALSDFNRAVAIKPDYPEAYFNRGVLFGRSGEVKKAIDDYTSAVTYKPRYAEAYYNRGILRLQSVEKQTALEDFSRTLEINPLFMKAYLNRGILLAGEKRFDGALLDFTRAVSIDNTSAKAFINRGIVYAMVQRFPLALSDFTKAISLNEQEVLAFINRSYVYKALGRFNLAYKDMETAWRLGHKGDRNYLRELETLGFKQY
ncbi:MAG: tetratricopeptide repeat protein [Nitrospinota bacterium]